MAAGQVLLAVARMAALPALLVAADPVAAGTLAVTSLTSDGAVTAARRDANLNNPWGVAGSRGKYAGDVQAGNFGDGWITSFPPASRGFQKTPGGGLFIADGLSALIPNSGGSANGTHFTAGTNDAADGRFRSLSFSP